MAESVIMGANWTLRTKSCCTRKASTMSEYRVSLTVEQVLTALQFAFGSSLGLVKISIVLLQMRIFFTHNFKIVGTSNSISVPDRLESGIYLSRC